MMATLLPYHVSGEKLRVPKKIDETLRANNLLTFLSKLLPNVSRFRFFAQPYKVNLCLLRVKLEFILKGKEGAAVFGFMADRHFGFMTWPACTWPELNVMKCHLAATPKVTRCGHF